MKRSSRFLIAFAAAAVTFASLSAFVGPRHWGRHGYGHCYADAGQWHKHHHSEGHRGWHRPENQPHEKPNEVPNQPKP